MNIAFSALLLAVFAVPGALFLFVYRRGFEDKPHTTSSFQTNIFLYLILAVPLHAAGVSAFEGLYLSPFPLTASDLVSLLIGANTPDFSAALESLRDSEGQLIVYLISIGLVSVLLGLIAHKIVRVLYLDVHLPIISPQSHYWYMFSGDKGQLYRRRFIQEEDIPARRAPDFIYVTLLLEVAGEAVLYWGQLLTYELGPGNTLERLVIGEAERRSLSRDRETGDRLESPMSDSRYYPIDGNFLVIEYKHVKNLNVEYAYVVEEGQVNAGEYDIDAIIEVDGILVPQEVVSNP